ncbi:MAG: glutamate-1-semialdehyde 2,1-aminomutase [Solirubrobacteraceae bacterium]
MPTTEQLTLGERARRVIPGGAHTYSKGDDQFPANAPRFIVRGAGCHVWDPDGREFIDWGMGLRSVILGHAYPRVVDAVTEAVRHGANFTRPSTVECEFAEELVDLIPCAEMVKFAKNGSDVTTAAVRLARAATGRELVAFPAEHPFYSVDDWFIGMTVIDGGVPDATKRLSRTFPYGDLAALEQLLAAEGERIALVIMETATDAQPPPGYLEGVRELTRRHGVLLAFDEMITGFRWHLQGSQAFYGVTPDMATFGKAIGNGFSVSALVGRRDVLELGGIDHTGTRVFLLSATHGGEVHALVAARETVAELRERDGSDRVWAVGRKLQQGLGNAIADHGLTGVVRCGGYPCSPVLEFTAKDAAFTAALRTLFLQETVSRGVLIPYIAPSLSHDARDIDRTVQAAHEALATVRLALERDTAEGLLEGPPVKPVFRRFSATDLDA